MKQSLKNGARSCALLLLLLLLFGGALPAQSPGDQRVFYLGMILGTGGLGDRSFNDSAYEGLRDAQRKFAIRFKTVDFASEEANLKALREFGRQSYDPVIGIGFENAKNIETVAGEFPQLRFAVIDAEAQGPNVASIVYREQEADFLMGVLAAMLTRTKIVGFIGGMDIPPIRRIQSGFLQGVAYQDPKVRVLSELAGTFTDPQKGKELALWQYAAGADLLYNAAGRTGLGIIEAARETGKLTLGTSGDQRYLAPGNVVGNRPKRVDTAVLSLVRDLRAGRFRPGVHSFGLKEGGLSLGPFDERIVSDAILNRLEELKRRIIAGEISLEAETR